MENIDYLIHNLKLTNRDIYESAIRFEEAGPFGLMVYCKDGSKVRYDDFNGDWFKWYPSDYDINKRSEECIIKDFKWRLKRTMTMRGIGQAKLAEMSGISQKTISNYLNGKNMPDILKLNKLARALDVDVSELLRDWYFYQRKTTRKKHGLLWEGKEVFINFAYPLYFLGGVFHERRIKQTWTWLSKESDQRS